MVFLIAKPIAPVNLFLNKPSRSKLRGTPRLATSIESRQASGNTRQRPMTSSEKVTEAVALEEDLNLLTQGTVVHILCPRKSEFLQL
jgi:hypothetical protein